MKKRFLAVLLVLVLAMSTLTGCGTSVKKASDPFGQIAEFKNVQYNIAVEVEGYEIEVNVKVTETGISLGVKADAKIDGFDIDIDDELLILTKDAAYINVSEDILDMLEEAGVDPDDISIEAGWSKLCDIPKGVNLVDYIYKAQNISLGMLSKMAKKCDIDGDEITFVFEDNFEDVAEIFIDTLDKDYRDLAKDILKDLGKVDYAKIIEDALDTAVEVIGELEDEYDMDLDMDVDDLKDEVIEGICDEFDIDDLDEINDTVQEVLEDADEELDDAVDELVEYAEDYTEFILQRMDDDFEFSFEMPFSTKEVTFEYEIEDIEFELTVTPCDKVSAPSKVNKKGAAAMVLGAVLAPSYLKYINKSQSANDDMNLSQIFIAAQSIAADVQFEMRAGDQFIIEIEDDEIDLDIDSNYADASDWYEAAGIDKHQPIRTAQGRYARIVGEVQSSGYISWSIKEGDWAYDQYSSLYRVM